MALETANVMEPMELKTLSKEEIDRRIERLMARVTDTAGLENPGAGEDDSSPRWITAAELVRRMRPFLVYN